MVDLQLRPAVREAFSAAPRRRPWWSRRPAAPPMVRSRVEYLDFVVGGWSLGVALGPAVRTPGRPEDRVSVLSLDWPDALTDACDVLLRSAPSELPDGRVPIYVCAECGDLGCGAVTAVVEHGPDVVVWRDLGVQTDYEEYDPHDTLADVGPFEFDAMAYRELLTDLGAAPD